MSNPWEGLTYPVTAPVQRQVFKEPKKAPGDKIGQWELLEYIPGTKSTAPKWRCCCSCGTERPVQVNNLNDGTSTSCGHDRAKNFNRGAPQ
jgi:hypothetical protein